MGVVIDTGVFIRWEREGGSIDLAQWSFLGEPCVSVITESELKVGVYRANTEERRTKRLLFVNAILTNVVVLPIDSKIANVHAQLVTTLTQNGMTIGPHDNWIAATALAHDYHLLTTNVSEFKRVPSLKVIDFSAKP